MQLSDAQKQATRSFRLLMEKRRMVLLNLPDDQADAAAYPPPGDIDLPVCGVPVGLERELARMSPEEAQQFRQEMGVGSADRDALLRQLMELSGQMLFFTAGPKEVRTWLIPQGATAVQAADSIHSDLARGFIRAEVMGCEDLIRLGSEREVKAKGLVRQEPKDYVVQDGDILNIRFSV
jgi:ribosome-binding ATPase YchF (GTP1/OBG family)